MKERIVEIATADGRIDAFVTHPQQNGPFPPVIFYMDVWGVRECAHRVIATTCSN